MRLVDIYLPSLVDCGFCQVVVSGDVGIAGISIGLVIPRFVVLLGGV
jgi:hypothetical protein